MGALLVVLAAEGIELALLPAQRLPRGPRRLNASWFLNLADATAAIEAWRQDYNGQGDLTPEEFARRAA